MLLLKLLGLFALGFFTFLLALLYYSPASLPTGLLDWAKGIIHSTYLSQNITFVIMCILVLLFILSIVLMATAKIRRLKKRRKRLLKMFEQYGAKYSALDKEINF